jgi:pantoate--beta-alanine ligase
MILFKKTNALRNYLDAQRKLGKKTGFVPTMGALHEGHLSLIQASRKQTDLTVCSIFVNPTQFNDPSDYQHYPITTKQDISMLLQAGCDVLFLPDAAEVYPDGTSPRMKYELGEMETLLEGKFRPGHFQGVCQVVHRLLDQVQPDALFLGQKDYQQCMVLSRLVQQTRYRDQVSIHICPTLREPDGLAMSSRNRRLSESARKQATTIFRVLSTIKEQLRPGELASLQQEATTTLDQAGFRTDYISIADAATLQPVQDWDGLQKIVAVAAAFLGPVRLIDNLPLN